MNWEIEYIDEFGDWWDRLSEEEQEALAASVHLLEERGPALGFPHSSGVKGSKHSHMRELRTQRGGRPLHTLYAFDPQRAAILLIGGNKTGDDRLYDEHLDQLRKEGLIDGQEIFRTALAHVTRISGKGRGPGSSHAGRDAAQRTASSTWTVAKNAGRSPASPAALHRQDGKTHGYVPLYTA